MPCETGTSCSTPAYGVAIICIFGVAYFGVCARIFWDEIAAAGRWLARLVTGRTAASRRSTQLLDELAANEARGGELTPPAAQSPLSRPVTGAGAVTAIERACSDRI